MRPALLIFAMVSSGGAILISCYILGDAVGDLKIVRGLGIGNGRQILARRYVETEAARLIVLALMLGAGGFGLYRVTIPAIVCFALAVLVLAADSVRGFHVRKAHLRSIRED